MEGRRGAQSAKRVEGWGWGGGIPSWIDGGGGCGGVERLTEKSRTTTRINRGCQREEGHRALVMERLRSRAALGVPTTPYTAPPQPCLVFPGLPVWLWFERSGQPEGNPIRKSPSLTIRRHTRKRKGPET